MSTARKGDGVRTDPALTVDDLLALLASQLFRHCAMRGFHFDLTAAMDGGPLVGTRASCQAWDTLVINGVTANCAALRHGIPGEGIAPVSVVTGSAAHVMTTVLNWGVVMLLGVTGQVLLGAGRKDHAGPTSLGTTGPLVLHEYAEHSWTTESPSAPIPGKNCAECCE